MLTAINPPLLPPSPLPIKGRQAGTLCCYTTGYSARGRLQAGLALTVVDLPSPPLDYPISTDSGKEKKKEEGSTRNVREGSMAKWGCHVVDSKPRSAVSLFLFAFNSLLPAKRPRSTLPANGGLVNLGGAWQRPGLNPSGSWLRAGRNLAVSRPKPRRLTWQSSRPSSRAVRSLRS